MTMLQRFDPDKPKTPAAIANEIRGLRERACQDVLEIGRLLIEAKRNFVAVGAWGTWLRNEFAWSQATAESFMNVAKVFGKTQSETFQILDPSSLYLLARPSTPQQARDAVLQRIEARNPPRFTDVRDIIREAKGKPGAAANPGAGSPSRGLTAPTMAVVDAILALINLGYKKAQAEEMIDAAARTAGDGADTETLIRVALKGQAKPSPEMPVELTPEEQSAKAFQAFVDGFEALCEWLPEMTDADRENALEYVADQLNILDTEEK